MSGEELDVFGRAATRSTVRSQRYHDKDRCVSVVAGRPIREAADLVRPIAGLRATVLSSRGGSGRGASTILSVPSVSSVAGDHRRT